jgi:hypothetical protein
MAGNMLLDGCAREINNPVSVSEHDRLSKFSALHICACSAQYWIVGWLVWKEMTASMDTKVRAVLMLRGCDG